MYTYVNYPPGLCSNVLHTYAARLFTPGEHSVRNARIQVYNCTLSYVVFIVADLHNVT